MAFISGVPEGSIAGMQAVWDAIVESQGDACILVKVTRSYTDKLRTKFTETTVETPTKCLIDWKPDMRELQLFALFAENVRPLVGFVKFSDHVTKGDRLKVAIKVPNHSQVLHELEVTDVFVENVAQLRCRVLLSPIRKQG